MDRINPDLFQDFFMTWAISYRLSVSPQIAIDAKTWRPTNDDSRRKAALHLASPVATHEGLFLGQETTTKMSTDITAFPILLERLTRRGALAAALVMIDAMDCNPPVVQSVIDHKTDYLIALKGNQQSLVDPYLLVWPTPLGSFNQGLQQWRTYWPQRKLRI